MKYTIKNGLWRVSLLKSDTTKRAKIAIEKAAAPYILAAVIRAPFALLYEGMIFGLINITKPTNNSNNPVIKIKSFMIF